jgi:hypothetical protein
VLVLAAIGICVWLATRPKPVAPVPWAVQARQQLEPLRHQPEDGSVLSRVSQVLEHYLTAVFALPMGEATTAEFCRALSDCEKVGAELARDIGDFLRECDVRKFAPSAPPTSLGAVECALKIVDRVEGKLADLNRPAATTAVSSSRPQEAGLARES